MAPIENGRREEWLPIERRAKQHGDNCSWRRRALIAETLRSVLLSSMRLLEMARGRVKASLTAQHRSTRERRKMVMAYLVMAFIVMASELRLR